MTMTNARIIAIGAPPTFRQQVARALGSEPDVLEWMPTVSAVEGSLADGGTPPHVLVLSPAVKEGDAFALAAFVGRASPATAVVLARENDLNGRLPEAMRAGVRDVIDLSRGGEELREALRRAVAWSENVRSLGGSGTREADLHRGKIYSVFSSKGGTGKTFLASNLASSIATEAKQDTAVVDLDLDLGDVFSYFGTEPARPLQDLFAMEEATREDILAVGTQLHPHLWGYGSHHDPSHNGIAGEAAGKALRTIRSTFPHTVVDATADYSDAALTTFDLSDEIFLISGLDIVGIRHLSLALQTLLSLGFPRERFRIVLNRADSKVGLGPADVQRVMKVSVDTMIPSSRLVPLSLNAGRPVVLEQPKAEVARSIQKLASRLAVPETSAAKRRLFRRH
jgi:pilus assembly protein CpaE